MALGTKYLVRAEINKIGIKWSNIFSPNTVESFVFACILGTFLLDAVLYGLVAWYIEAVFPGEYGVPKPWNFFLLPSYWFGEKPKKTNESRQFYKTIETKYFEAEPTDLVAGIQLQHLCKEFRVHNTTKLAVKDLSLNVYEGQITVLLGHNGAGKSTTLSILSGLYPATSGEAYVNGFAISKQMVQIRKSLGLCPQQDLLFNYLTVSEHLYFYCMIKGVPRKMYPIESDRMLSAFNLIEKQNAFSASLSGGMKRKLSVIIALIGGSKVVILDEPTAGMDPASRRATRDLLQQYKQGRTILLTTHYMDEADILGDRIAIMVKGSLRCCGSSLFLKNIYGVGYHIVIVKAPHCNVEEISKLIYYHIPSAALEKNVMNELSFLLPKEYTHRFEALFTDLERRHTELGIASFGVTITTMEEVFFSFPWSGSSPVTGAGEPLALPYCSHIVPLPVSKQIRESSKLGVVTHSPNKMYWDKCSLYHQQFCAMFIKRAIFNWRNWKLILLQILALLGSLILLSETVMFTHSNDDKARLMSLSQYGQTIVPLSISGNSNLTLIFLKHLKSMLEPDNHTLKEVQGDLLKYLMENEDCIHLCIVAFSIEVKKDKITFTGLFNNQAYHSPALSLAMLDNILFMSTSGPDASITVFNKPQPTSTYKKYSSMLSEGDQVAINIHFGMALLVSGFCLLTVTERITKAKLIQFLSGVYVLAYWLSALLWDLTIFFIACCLLLGMFKFCQLDEFLTDYHFLDTVLIVMLFGWSAIPLIYLLSFLFSQSTSAYIKLVVFSYLSGICSLIIDATFQFEFFIILPGKIFCFSSSPKIFLYSLEEKTLMIATGSKYKETAKMERQRNNLQMKESPDKELNKRRQATYHTEFKVKVIKVLKELSENYKELSGDYSSMKNEIETMNQNQIEMKNGISDIKNTLEGIKSRLDEAEDQISDLKDKGKVSEELSGECKDEDVENERKRILEQPQELLNSSVLIKELIKIYFKCPVILAVKNISITIQKGECFGLLGLNGAGKTTTFQILTGEETATSGHVFIEGFSITDNIQKVKSRVGYCPQSDALLEYMTGREIMIMYARLWGVSESQIQLYVSKWLTSLQLESHADRIIRTYSGGNKRRLSTAIALMGKPTIILLDEPSTGMDPVARRLLWDAVMQARESGKTIIITSHRMEECDAYCTRLAIMVKGKFVCLGSPQHLKNKFGDVYILKVKVKTDTHKHTLNDFKDFITMTFPGNIQWQENQGILNYYIPRKDNSWSKVFGVLEEAKEQFNLEDYSVSQITLEQVFLTFANLENNGLDGNKEVP
ncbi:phospholipid-transporting ATPase ABCA3-like [Myotis yumanensis]|uniref:phospholipid-transporting ATPase ABCA3-like n=1 Tax=Myotis yumanensis TaxID=159337 RepID=UPI0038D0BE41